VRCLENITDEMFVSGYLDGSIVVWQTESFSHVRTLYYPDQFLLKSDQFKYYTESVNHLLVLGRRYLAACIDKGFKIFDTWTGDCVMDNTKAHDSTVFSIISVSGGTQFVTASADAQIKLWGTAKDFSFTVLEEDEAGMFKSRRKKKVYYPPVCLGEMWAHTDQVKLLLKISETSFASGGHDKLVILWKHGEMETQLRCQDSAHSLDSHPDFAISPLPSPSPLSSTSHYQSLDGPHHTDGYTGATSPQSIVHKEIATVGTDADNNIKNYNSEPFITQAAADVGVIVPSPRTAKSIKGSPGWGTTIEKLFKSLSRRDSQQMVSLDNTHQEFPLKHSGSSAEQPSDILSEKLGLEKPSEALSAKPLDASTKPSETLRPLSPKPPDLPPQQKSLRKVSPKGTPENHLSHLRYVYAIAENLWLEQQLSKDEIRDYLVTTGHDKTLVNDVIATLALFRDVKYL